MIAESKVIDLFCMADEFCKFFDAMMTKYTLKPATKPSGKGLQVYAASFSKGCFMEVETSGICTDKTKGGI